MDGAEDGKSQCFFRLMCYCPGTRPFYDTSWMGMTLETRGVERFRFGCPYFFLFSLFTMALVLVAFWETFSSFIFNLTNHFTSSRVFLFPYASRLVLFYGKRLLWLSDRLDLGGDVEVIGFQVEMK